jgi:uncharacterized coiled-coil protein SlyX
MSAAQNPWPHIGQLFVEEGYLTSAQLEGALAEQRRSGDRLGEILIERGYITRIHLAGALSKQWSWKGEIPSSIESPAALTQLSDESVEPEPIEPPADPVPVSELSPTVVPVPELSSTEPSATLVQAPEETTETEEPEPVVAASEPVPVPAFSPTLVPLPGLPSIDPPPPVHPSANGTPVATPAHAEVEANAAPQPLPPAFEEQERLLQELQARLRETHEQLAAGEERIGSLDAILGDLSQTCAALNARLDAQTREIDDLRRVVADQSTRLASAASALLA